MKKELEKVEEHKTESALAFEDMSVANRATNLVLYELLGDANLMNTELEKYQAITAEDIRRESQLLFDVNNSNTIYYYSN